MQRSVADIRFAPSRAQQAARAAKLVAKPTHAAFACSPKDVWTADSASSQTVVVVEADGSIVAKPQSAAVAAVPVTASDARLAASVADAALSEGLADGEEKPEAAAVDGPVASVSPDSETAAHQRAAALGKEEPALGDASVMRFDRPFLFAVTETATGVVSFVGVIRQTVHW